MFWLFVNRGWEPEKYLKLPPGEKAVIDAMVQHEIELREKAIENAKGRG